MPTGVAVMVRLVPSSNHPEATSTVPLPEANAESQYWVDQLQVMAEFWVMANGPAASPTPVLGTSPVPAQAVASYRTLP